MSLIKRGVFRNESVESKEDRAKQLLESVARRCTQSETQEDEVESPQAVDQQYMIVRLPVLVPILRPGQLRPGEVVNLFPATILLHCLHRMFLHPGFKSFNPHLTAAEMSGLLLDPIQWPWAPLFSPYVAVKDQYTQLVIPTGEKNGRRIHTHRVAMKVFLGGNLPLELDCSHLLHCGLMTTRNFNPRMLVMETHDENMKRVKCAEVYSAWKKRCSDGELPPGHDAGRALQCELAESCARHSNSAGCVAWNETAWGDPVFLERAPFMK